jgi:signal transduction histidine kinase
MKKILILIIICFNLFQIKANNVNKKETLIPKVSFLLQQNDNLYAKKFLEIDKLYKEQNYVKALEKAFIFYDLSKDKNVIFWSYKTSFLIASIYNRTNKYKKSLEFYKKSLELIKISVLEKGNVKFSDSNYAKTLLRIGSSYQKLSISENENNSLYYIDSAKHYYEKVESLPELNNEIVRIKAVAFSNLSGIYEKDSIFDKAESYVKKAIVIHKKLNKDLGVAKAINNLGNIFLSQKQYKKSKDLYLEALDLIKNNDNPIANRTKASLYYNLAWAMRNLKDYKSYDYQEKSFNIQDTIREKEFRSIIAELSYEYDFESEKKLLEEQQKVKILQEKDKNKSIIFIGAFLLICLIFIVGYYFFRQKKLQLELTRSELIQNQKLDKLKSESQARVLDATLNGKESERKEISEILHDSVSAMLSSANLHLQATRKQFDNKVPIEIDKSQQIIIEASKKIRDLSHTLVSSVLLKFGLNFAIKDIAEKYSNSDLTIAVEIQNIRRYHQTFEMKIHNIIQELTNNILKHSKAKNAFISLKEQDSLILLQIIDDGIGFDKTKIASKDGLGINQIKARIHMMKGTFKVVSDKESGTKISVEIPIQEKIELTSLS